MTILVEISVLPSAIVVLWIIIPIIIFCRFSHFIKLVAMGIVLIYYAVSPRQPIAAIGVSMQLKV